MEITLRQATKYRQQLEELANRARRDIDANVSVKISFADNDLGAQISDAREKVLTSFGRYQNATTALFDLRRTIGKRNNETVLPELLSNVAELNREIDVLTRLVNTPHREASIPHDRLLSRQEAWREGMKAGVRQSAEEYVPTLTEGDYAMLESLLIARKRELVDTQDEIEAINMSSKIVVPPSVVEFMEREKLV